MAACLVVESLDQIMLDMIQYDLFMLFIRVRSVIETVQNYTTISDRLSHALCSCMYRNLGTKVLTVRKCQLIFENEMLFRRTNGSKLHTARFSKEKKLLGYVDSLSRYRSLSKWYLK